MVVSLIAGAVSLVVGFVLTMLFYKKEETVVENKEVKVEETVLSPIKGEVKAIEESSDAAFASGALGKVLSSYLKKVKFMHQESNSYSFIPKFTCDWNYK